MWLPWQTAFQVAAALAVVLVVLVVWRPAQRWLRVVRLTVGEMVLMFSLYGVWQWVHERAVTKTSGAIGFHGIPIHVADGTPYQTDAELGTRLSGGCQRQNNLDAKFLWDWANVGTTVVVV